MQFTVCGHLVEVFRNASLRDPVRGQVQEEELESWRAAGERGPKAGWMRVQGETSKGSPCDFFYD